VRAEQPTGYTDCGPEGGSLSEAACAFFEATYPAARAGCCNQLRGCGCTEDEAEEIFMETFEKVMRTVDPIGRGFAPAQMVVLLKVSCRRRLIDLRRHQRVIAEVGLDAVGELADSTAAGPEDVAEDRESAALGAAVIASLPTVDRRVFRQRHELGLTPSEICRRTPGLSPRSYRRTIERANARVRREFERRSAA
jgi:RNA polymerase sigma factor (sigma-70 family)